MDSWPFSKISEIHPSNDIVFESGGILAHVDDCDGNLRLMELVREKQLHYQRKTSLERPLVAVEIINKWRCQEPPGRFLIQEKETNPPLWKDIGDKKARAYISKTLKQQVSSSATTSIKLNNVDGSCLESCRPAKSVSCESENKPEVTFASVERPLHPLLPAPNKNTRSISESFHAARTQGMIYARFQERNRLAQILKNQIARDIIYDEADAREAAVVDVVLIEGFVGVGKTALARTMKCPLLLQANGGEADESIRPRFFLESKFEHLRTPDPYKPFVEIFNDFCRQLLLPEKEELLPLYRKALMKAVPDDHDMLIQMIPQLWDILSPGSLQSLKPHPWDCSEQAKSQLSTCSRSPGMLRMERVKSLFSELLRAISFVEPQKPLVVFIDDMHWASEFSLDIFTSLVCEVEANIVFVASIRQGCQCNHKIHCDKTKEKLLASRSVDIHTLSLPMLDADGVEDMLEGTLQCDYHTLQSLTPLVCSLTQGNPTCIIELLRTLQDEGILYHDRFTGKWICDFEKIRMSFRDVESVLDVIKRKLKKLPADVRKTLAHAACVGSTQIDESLLTLLGRRADTRHHLRYAEENGLLRHREGCFRFASDGVHHAVYYLIPQSDRAALHLGIGQKLWQHLSTRKDEEFRFIILNQLMMGDSLLKDESDVRTVASLCLEVGEAAARTSGFQTAWVYLAHGIALLPKKTMWGRDNYDLCLRLHNLAVEVCYANCQYELLDELIETILQHSRVFEDSLIARSTKIYALGSRNRLGEAIEVGLSALKQLGEPLPPYPASHEVHMAFLKTNRMLRSHSDESILLLRSMNDKRVLAATEILNHLYLYAFYSRPSLAALIAARFVQLTLRFGLSAISSVGFGFYAMFLCGRDFIEEGCRCGDLAQKLYHKFNNEAWLCRNWLAFYGNVALWRLETSDVLEPLLYAHKVGLKTGDIEYAMLNGSLYCWSASEILPLPALQKRVKEIGTSMEVAGHSMAIAVLEPLRQFILNFSADDKSRKFEFLQVVSQESERAIDCSNQAVIDWFRATTMVTAFHYSEYGLAEQFTHEVNRIYENSAFCIFGSAFVLVFECMTLLVNIGKCGPLARLRRLAYVRKRLKRLKNWAFHSGSNLLDKMHLLQAEFSLALGDYKKACLKYRSAILHARSRGALAFEALGNERLARCMLGKGDPATAKPLLEEACRIYDHWGAPAKCRKLRSEYETFISSTDEVSNTINDSTRSTGMDSFETIPTTDLILGSS